MTEPPGPQATRPLLVVDAANVVGSVPDGWWRDRAGAATRLRDTLAPLADTGLPGGPTGPLDIVLVVEGAARKVPATPGVHVDAAPGSGDDHIVHLVTDATQRQPQRPVLVATADRDLRRRVQARGATVVGPSTLGYRGRR